MSDKPTILILPGGWLAPKSFGKLTAALQKAGFDVECPHYPSLSPQRPPIAGLEEDSASVRKFVEGLLASGRKIIVLAHSYGGQVASNSLYDLGIEARSAQNLPGGVVEIVYMCASALPLGQSMYDKVVEMGHRDLVPIAFHFEEDMTVTCANPKAQLIGEWDDDAEVEDYLASLSTWNGQCMYDPIHHTAWKEIPVSYIYTHRDGVLLFPDYQKSMVALLEEQGRPVRTFDLEDAGHCPHFTVPDAVVAILEKVAA